MLLCRLDGMDLFLGKLIIVWRIRMIRLSRRSNLDYRGIDIRSTLNPIYNLDVEQLDHCSLDTRWLLKLGIQLSNG